MDTKEYKIMFIQDLWRYDDGGVLSNQYKTIKAESWKLDLGWITFNLNDVVVFSVQHQHVISIEKLK